MWFIHELHHFLNLNCIFFPANEATLITKQPIRFQGLFKVTNQIAEKWKTKGIVANFAIFVSKTLTFFPPKKWMNLISHQLSTASYIWTDQVLYLSNFKMDVFWSEIILVISNETCTARSFNFEIMRMISAQIALHSVQLPLLSAKVLPLLDKDIEEGVHTLEKTIMWEVLFTLSPAGVTKNEILLMSLIKLPAKRWEEDKNIN